MYFDIRYFTLISSILEWILTHSWSSNESTMILKILSSNGTRAELFYYPLGTDLESDRVLEELNSSWESVRVVQKLWPCVIQSPRRCFQTRKHSFRTWMSKTKQKQKYKWSSRLHSLLYNFLKKTILLSFNEGLLFRHAFHSANRHPIQQFSVEITKLTKDF